MAVGLGWGFWATGAMAGARFGRRVDVAGVSVFTMLYLPLPPCFDSKYVEQMT